MGYTDEEIIKLMNAHKTGVSGSIEDGFVVKEEKIIFKEVLLFEDKMQIMLPENFEDMSVEAAKIKYPMEQRPAIIKTNKDGDINFTFNLLEQPLDNSQVEDVVNMLRNVLKKTNPSNKCGNVNLECVDNKNVAWFDVVNNGLDHNIFHIMYVLPINQKLMHGVFNCIVEDSNNWKQIALEVIRSIKENEDDKK